MSEKKAVWEALNAARMTERLLAIDYGRALEREATAEITRIEGRLEEVTEQVEECISDVLYYYQHYSS